MYIENALRQTRHQQPLV